MAANDGAQFKNTTNSLSLAASFASFPRSSASSYPAIPTEIKVKEILRRKGRNKSVERNRGNSGYRRDDEIRRMIGKGRREQGEGRIHSVWRYSTVLICRRRIARRSGRGGRTDQRLLGCTRLRNDTRNTRWSSGINAIAYRLQDRLVIELSRHLLFLVDPCSERKHCERRPTKAIDSDLYRALKSRTISI
ncbi:hypothetical protein V1477_015342, partial [Vespula maculifrons]